MNQEEINILKRALAREKASRKAAESILEEKSTQLYEVNKKLEESHVELMSLYKQANTQLQGVFENIVDAYVVMDLQGNVLKMNEAAVKLLEFDTAYDYINLMSLVDPNEVNKIAPKFEQLMESGSITDFEIKIITQKGIHKFIHINASMIYENDVPIASQGIVRDITSDREKNLIIELINDVAKSILGKIDIYEIASVITGNIAEYLDTNDCVIYVVNTERNVLEQISAYGEKLNTNNEIEAKIEIPIGNGIVGSVAKTGIAEVIDDTSKDPRYIVDDKRRFSEIAVPIINEGVVIGVIDSEHHSKKYFTKEQLSTLKNIANLVALQLKSAINYRERLKVETKNTLLLEKLEKSNEELQEYAHVVSHDLKSPLRSINALVSWIKEDNKGKLDEISVKNIELIEMTLEKMEQLISDVLNYSSLGFEVFEKADVDIDVLVNDLIKIQYIPKHIKINVLKPLPIIQGDRVKLQQLFQNLLSNAIKFIDKSQGLIEIDYQELNTHYKFLVKDNGIGIEEKFYKKIFKIFNSLNKNKESTGVGLAIAKKIVDFHEGEIWLESTPNVGTVFYFSIKK